MIDSLRGELISKTHASAVIECGGVGFHLMCSSNTLSDLPSIGEEAFIFTVLSVKENAMDLYGFSTVLERDLFNMLCSVSGVGPKIAISILSSYLPDRIVLGIASQDIAFISSCPGVGNRIAQRIVVELKDKISDISSSESVSSDIFIPTASESSEALAALTALGFSNSESAKVLSRLDPSLKTEELIREALRLLGEKK